MGSFRRKAAACPCQTKVGAGAQSAMSRQMPPNGSVALIGAMLLRPAPAGSLAICRTPSSRQRTEKVGFRARKRATWTFNDRARAQTIWSRKLGVMNSSTSTTVAWST